MQPTAGQLTAKFSMTRSIPLRTAIALVLFSISASSRAADSPVQAGDEKPVRALIAAFGEAFAKLDAHAFSMVFHEDADFTNVWGMTAHGRKAIEEFHRPLLEGDGAGPIPSFKHAEFKVLETKIRFLRPDVASVDVIWSQTGAVQNGHDMGYRKGLLMLVATREDGHWGIAVMHNMDLPVTK
ncbi:MAG: SgcJ/EcaC family oxidoreductase [Verrucomicrobiota bacterium]|nr:SgcJ/EcaC family oxidoreductase [Verrucomicrobiota bacterium]